VAGWLQTLAGCTTWVASFGGVEGKSVGRVFQEINWVSQQT